MCVYILAKKFHWKNNIFFLSYFEIRGNLFKILALEFFCKYCFSTCSSYCTTHNLGLMKCHNAHKMGNESKESDPFPCLIFACVKIFYALKLWDLKNYMDLGGSFN